MEHIFCLCSPLEHTLVYVFLFTLKYIGSMFYKTKDKGFCKKTNLMLRRLDFTCGSFNEDSIAYIFTESQNGFRWKGHQRTSSSDFYAEGRNAFQ